MYRCINLQTFNLAMYNLMNKGLALAAPFFYFVLRKSMCAAQ
jgi:hypothetical protein